MADMPSNTQTIDITPESLKDPKLAEEVRIALANFEDSTALVANMATTIIEAGGLRANDEFHDDFEELREAIQDRRTKQEAFLKALAARTKKSQA